MALWQLLFVFGGLSLMAVGGGTSTLPAMRDAVVSHGWMSAQEFTHLYNIGQLNCGPNMLMVVELGRRVAGPPGAIMAGLAFFAPPCLLALAVSRTWNRFSHSPWRLAVQRGLAPLTVGLMLASAHMLATSTLVDRPTLAIGAVATILLYYSRRVNPALLVLSAGALGCLFGG